MRVEIKRADGSNRVVAGYRYAAPRPGHKRFAAAAHVSRLPARVDLRPHMTAVENQGDTNSCVANAVAGAYEYLVKRHLGEDAYDVSRMFIYYNARYLEDAEADDEGTAIADAIEGLRTYGACAEDTWPFDEDQVNAEPDDQAYDEAKDFLVEDMALVPVELDAWRQALAEGNPIIFGISLYESFDAHRKKGLVPLPSPKEAARESHGGHAMLCVGYSDPDKLFIVRNSWGDDWGDGGYCYIPYGYLMNPAYNDGDSWVIRRLENLDVDHATWSDDDGSVLPDLDTELAAMSEDAHHALLDALGDVPLETRMALLYLAAAGADGDLADDEVTAIAESLTGTLEQVGSTLKPARVLKHAARLLGHADVLEQTIALFGEHLSKGMLAAIINDLTAIADSDGTADEEASFVDALVEAWQVADEVAASAEEGEEDEGEEEDGEDGEGDEGDEGDEEEGDEEDEEDEAT